MCALPTTESESVTTAVAFSSRVSPSMNDFRSAIPRRLSGAERVAVVRLRSGVTAELAGMCPPPQPISRSTTKGVERTCLFRTVLPRPTGQAGHTRGNHDLKRLLLGEPLAD